MANAHDVAAYILEKHGPMTAMKLQKLVYYSQAWSLVWDDRPLFAETIEAWANGPVIRDLYARHRGMFQVSSWQTGDARKLTPSERDTVDQILKFYGDKSSQWLGELTHQEAPWLDARRGLGPAERGGWEISIASMAEYYGGLV